ncbi:aldolase [Pseudomonas oryzihabitans]|nr:class II aldolase [Pseudomonas psychrotolerans]KTT00025.1 aldolase [Pseudomonas psychrotolerans]KTT11947.1 aldolase [Pseudomonas psychrotolerans]KTT22373.1 aldolase [Pseudomonas psychrotolerans]KTT35740.1 aldolase [Pseudomonas psychrotolerans]
MSKPLTLSESEWQARCELAALYRLIAYYRMTDLIDTHITLRVPGSERHFLINRYGVAFERMRASDLVLIDQDGEVVDSHFSGRVNAAGFVIHSAIHAARPDLHCIIHTHTVAGMAVAAQREGLLPLSQHALKFYGNLAYHTYEGIALSLEERERLVADLGPHKKAMILRNHGLLAAGRSVAAAFHEIYFLERACQAQIQALAGGVALNLPSEAVCRHTAAQFDRDGIDGIIDLAWQAALSLIEAQRADWCS